MEYNLHYFCPDCENISILTKLFKKQGVDVCRNKLNRDWVNKSLHTMSFGMAYLTQKAQIGRRSLKSEDDKYIVHGLILCRIEKEQPEIAWIDIVCSRQNSKVGNLLMEVVESKCRSEKNIKLIQLYSLPDEKLTQWYKKQSFIISPVTIWDGNQIKAYLMQKFLV